MTGRPEDTRRERPARRGPGGGPPGMFPVSKAKDFKGSLRKLAAYLTAYRYRLLLVLFCAIGGATFAVIGPKILGRATQELFRGLVAKVSGSGLGIDFGYIAGILTTLLVLYGLSSLFQLITGYIMTGIAQEVSCRLREQISRKINRLPMAYFDRVTHGDVLSRVTNDVDTVGQSLNQSLTQIISSLVSLIGVLIMMFSISVLLTAVTLIILPVSTLLMRLIMKRSQKFFAQQQKTLAEVNSQVEETYGGHVVVQAYNGEQAARERFDETNGRLYRSAWQAQFYSGLMMPLMMFIGNIGYVVVAILGGILAVRKVIDVGDIQSFIQYVQSFNQPIAQAAQIGNLLQSTVAAAERVFEFLEEAEEKPDPEQPKSTDGLLGQVGFDHVRFGYLPDTPIIHDFTATVEPCRKIAIVGPTGAGKTTMVKLLMRFYDVDEGSIRIDGHDVREFTRAGLRRLFGMVLQDTWLFTGTIRENIRYGKPDADDRAVEAAARAAHAHGFIRTLPGGYDMILNEDASNISQGQRQLLTIARAILADPDILILDEATSSVDTRTEAQIQKAMDALAHGRTSFIIAHRLSTIRNADLILVMRDGDIVEQGTHDELLRQPGSFYAELYNAQFKGLPAAAGDV